MNICIYTSSVQSITNHINITHLINERPNHNYSFLVVKRDEKILTLKDKLKKVYGELRSDDGRYDYGRDLIKLDEKLMHMGQPISKFNLETEFVDKVNDSKSESFLLKNKPDIILQAGAGILKENIFNKARIATINVHHGIAPEIRGIDSTFWCMFYGIKEKIGVTCHIIDEHLDTGAIIHQEALVTKTQSLLDIQSENYLMGRNVLVKGIDRLGKGNIKIEKQGEVKSWYFGVVNPFLYYALKKRNFSPIMKISDKAFKMKERNIVIPA